MQRKKLYSEALDKRIRVKVTTRVLRTIDKVGGLDNYLLGDKSARVKELGMEGWKLRWEVLNTKAANERFAAQREELGLPSVEPIERVELKKEFKSKVGSLPNGKKRLANSQRLARLRKRRDVWQDDTIVKLLRKSNESSEQMLAEQLMKDLRAHKSKLTELKKAKKEKGEFAKMMPRNKELRPGVWAPTESDLKKYGELKERKEKSQVPVGLIGKGGREARVRT